MSYILKNEINIPHIYIINSLFISMNFLSNLKSDCMGAMASVKFVNREVKSKQDFFEQDISKKKFAPLKDLRTQNRKRAIVWKLILSRGEPIATDKLREYIQRYYCGSSTLDKQIMIEFVSRICGREPRPVGERTEFSKITKIVLRKSKITFTYFNRQRLLTLSSVN